MSNKGLIIAGISLLAVSAGVGAYLIIKRKKKDPSRDQSAEDLDQAIIEASGSVGQGGSASTTPADTAQSEYAALPLGNFPLKKGQQSKFIWIFQEYMNCRFKAGLDVDGKAGTKTETAMVKYLGKSVINNMTELKTIVAQKTGIQPGSASAYCESRAEGRWNQARRASEQLRNFVNFA